MVQSELKPSQKSFPKADKVDQGYNGIILVQRGSSIEQVLRPDAVRLKMEKIGEQRVVYVSNPSQPTPAHDPLYFEFI